MSELDLDELTLWAKAAADSGVLLHVSDALPLIAAAREAERMKEENARLQSRLDAIEGLLERHDQTFRSQIKDIMAGDGLPHVSVVDIRRAA